MCWNATQQREMRVRGLFEDTVTSGGGGGADPSRCVSHTMWLFASKLRIRGPDPCVGSANRAGYRVPLENR